MNDDAPSVNPEPTREEALFQAAQHIAGPARKVLLDAACHGDPALRERLEALLAVDDTKNSLLGGTDGPVARKAATIQLKFDDELGAPDEAVGQSLGRYKLLERIGEGGCGVVYVAEQTEPVRRRVALKVIKLGMDTKQVVARFEAERQALAMMDHPNIAKVLDAGTTEMGRPYFVMELVRGIPFTHYCDQAQLGTNERLYLFIKVCQAIQHAHQKGIIHRDIKPSNILVTLHDGVPVPKVIDFGIAKATEGRLTDNTVYTQLHQFIGTPAYMSPEQAEMSGLDIDTRSDIYSLGVLLYELLAGSTPFDAKELMAAGIDAMRRTIREKEPARPSTKLASLRRQDLSTTAKRRSAEVPKLLHQVQGDLDWIVMKCLEKDRTRRYETANGLAADVTRHLTNEPVIARPPSTAYRLQKALRRNRLGFAAAAAVALVLVLGIAVSSWQAVRATKAEREQSQLRQQAEAAKAQESTARQQAELARANEAKQRKQAEAAREVAERFKKRIYLANIQNAALAAYSKTYERARLDEQLDKWIPEQSEPDPRGFEWWHLDFCRNSLVNSSNRLSDFQPTCVAFKATNGNFYLGGSNGVIALIDGFNLKLLHSWTGHQEPIRAIALSPNRARLATGAGSTTRVWSLPNGVMEAEWPCAAAKLAFATDDTVVALNRDAGALGTSVGRIEVWGVRSRQMVKSLALECIDFDWVQSNTTNVVACLTAGGGISVLSLPAFEQTTRASAPTNWHRIALSPTLDAVAGLNTENHLSAIRLRDGFLSPAKQDMYSARPATNRFTCLGWWPDGDVVVCGSSDSFVEMFIYKLADHFGGNKSMSRMSGEQDFSFLGRSGPFGSDIVGLQESARLGLPDTIVTGSGLISQSIRLDTQKAIPNTDNTGGDGERKGARQVVYDSHGKRAAFYQENNGLALFDLDERRVVRQLTNNWGYVILLGFTKDDSAIQIVSYPLHRREEEEVIGPQQATLETWDIGSGKLRAKAFLEKAVYTSPHQAYLSSDGRWLVGPYFGPNSNESRFGSSGLGLWEAASGRLVRRMDRWNLTGNSGVESCAISPTDAVVAVALESGGVSLCRLDSEEVKELVPGGQKPTHEGRSVTFTPDGRSLLVAKPKDFESRDSGFVEFERYELNDSQRPIPIKLKVGRDGFSGFKPPRVAYSPDGRNLVACVGGEIRLFSADGGEAYFRLPSGKWSSHRSFDSGEVRFAPDGRTLSAVSYEGSVEFWFARRTQDR